MAGNCNCYVNPLLKTDFFQVSCTGSTTISLVIFKIFKNSFFVKTVIDWNKLSDDIVNSSTIDIFKVSVFKQQ